MTGQKGTADEASRSARDAGGGGRALRRRPSPLTTPIPAELRAVNEALLLAGLRERELAEVLEAERAQLAAILADIGDAVLVVGPTGSIVRTNAAYARLAGEARAPLAPHDAQGQPLPVDATPQARASRGESFRLEFAQQGVDGRARWYEANGQPLHDRGHEVGVVVIRDITLAHTQRQMQDAFLSLASHELRTPLTSVQGYLDLAFKQLQGSHDDTRALRYVTHARGQTQRLTALIGDLTDVARLHSGKLTLTRTLLDLRLLTARVVETARDLPPGHAIELDVRGDALPVHGDAGRLEQVLLNLLTNAFAHAPGLAPVVVQLRRQGNEGVLAVRDQGPGIAADQLPHLFERFYQVADPHRPAQGGLGLGLFICQEVVTAHGGRIAVASVEGEGTTFTVWLPLTETAVGGQGTPGA